MQQEQACCTAIQPANMSGGCCPHPTDGLTFRANTLVPGCRQSLWTWWPSWKTSGAAVPQHHLPLAPSTPLLLLPWPCQHLQATPSTNECQPHCRLRNCVRHCADVLMRQTKLCYVCLKDLTPVCKQKFGLCITLTMSTCRRRGVAVWQL